jgi:hypothetical protein
MRPGGLVLAIMIFICLAPMSFAQTSDWAVVNQLVSAQKVKVQTADGKSHVGRVQSVSEDMILIGKNQSIQKQDVRQILLWSPGHHGRNALIGLGIGAGLGVAFGATCSEKNSIVSTGQCMAVGAPFFGGIGAGIGALLPSHGKWHEVYRTE